MAPPKPSKDLETNSSSSDMPDPKLAVDGSVTEEKLSIYGRTKKALLHGLVYDIHAVIEEDDHLKTMHDHVMPQPAPLAEPFSMRHADVGMSCKVMMGRTKRLGRMWHRSVQQDLASVGLVSKCSAKPLTCGLFMQAEVFEPRIEMSFSYLQVCHTFVPHLRIQANVLGVYEEDGFDAQAMRLLTGCHPQVHDSNLGLTGVLSLLCYLCPRSRRGGLHGRPPHHCLGLLQERIHR